MLESLIFFKKPKTTTFLPLCEAVGPPVGTKVSGQIHCIPACLQYCRNQGQSLDRPMSLRMGQDWLRSFISYNAVFLQRIVGAVELPNLELSIKIHTRNYIGTRERTLMEESRFEAVSVIENGSLTGRTER